MTLSHLAYQTATKFEDDGLDVWSRNNEDHIIEGWWYSKAYVSIEICQKKFADGAWGYEIRLYIKDNQKTSSFNCRMSEKKSADYYYAMINNKIEEKIWTL